MRELICVGCSVKTRPGGATSNQCQFSSSCRSGNRSSIYPLFCVVPFCTVYMPCRSKMYSTHTHLLYTPTHTYTHTHTHPHTHTHTYTHIYMYIYIYIYIYIYMHVWTKNENNGSIHAC